MSKRRDRIATRLFTSMMLFDTLINGFMDKHPYLTYWYLQDVIEQRAREIRAQWRRT